MDMTSRFLFGCCYYPEHWERESMKRDLERIKGLGINCIRMGEFSWSMYEREEGKYDFSLLEEAVREAQRLGISVILGTPTAAPPRWLTEKHPEVLCTNSQGTVMQHGSCGHQGDGAMGHDTGIKPAFALFPVHQEHVVGGDLAEAHLGGVNGLLLGGSGSGNLNIQHGRNAPLLK